METGVNGDMITKAEIRNVACPRHGEHCESWGPFTPCRARIDKAIRVKHSNRVRENARKRSACNACARGDYHVHLG